MSITKYSNFEDINRNIQNEGKFLQYEDFFIVTKKEIQDTDFGECRYDVMEVSVYDVNNNLLPQKSGNNVAYIKTGDIKNYMYNVTNTGGKKEFAIDVEILLNDLGFTNGILKVNINFIRNRVGSDNELTKVWIQEISPSREEVRILPLKVSDNVITEKNKKDFSNINNLNQDFKYYKKRILDTLDSFKLNSITKINDVLVSKFGNDFVAVLKKDFGISDFDAFRNRIFDNFKESIDYWLNNKNYDITQSNYGKPSLPKRFEDCEQYDFQTLINEVQNILSQSILVNIKSIKRRGVTLKSIPKEFSVVELRKEVKDVVDSFGTPIEIKRNVYTPDKVSVVFDDLPQQTPIVTYPITEVPPTDTPAPTPQPEPITPIQPINEPAPVIEPPSVIPTPIEPPLVIEPTPIIEPVINNVTSPSITPTPVFQEAGGSGGYLSREIGIEDGRYIYEDRSREMVQ